MLIKYTNLPKHLQSKPMAAIYILVGNTFFLFDEINQLLRKTFSQLHPDFSRSKIYIEAASNWELLEQEYNNLSLFTEAQILEIYCEQKDFNIAGKKILQNICKTSNENHLIIIQAPYWSLKSLSGFSQDNKYCVVPLYPLAALELIQWLKHKLTLLNINFTPKNLQTILFCAQNNMLSCHQFLSKIAVYAEDNFELTEDLIRNLFNSQIDYELYQLIDAYLKADPSQALRIIRHAYNNKIEPSLVLWLLTQELRHLIVLANTYENQFLSQAKKLHIWSNKTNLYRQALKRFKLNDLLTCLKQCQIIDEQIKSNNKYNIWRMLELVVIFLCLGNIINVGICE